MKFDIRAAKAIHLEKLKNDPLYRREFRRKCRLGWRRKLRAEARTVETPKPKRRGQFSYVQQALAAIDKQITHLQQKRATLVSAQRVIDETVR